MRIKSLASLKVTSYIIPAYNFTPNSSILDKPLLIYHGVFESNFDIKDVESHFIRIGVVQPQWRYTMYKQSHFHSTSHEVLAVVQGQANLRFGHEDNPHSIKQNVTKGDVIIIPAGVAHRLDEDISGDFLMVGCYPSGCQWDMCYGNEDEKDKLEKIKDLKWFAKDPIYGDNGPVLSCSHDGNTK